jgi:hypothetical protein
MDIRQYSFYYFEKCRKNLPFGSELTSISLNGRPYNNQIPQFGDIVTLYYKYGKTKLNQSKRAHFEYIWGQLQQEDRNRKIDQLFD